MDNKQRNSNTSSSDEPTRVRIHALIPPRNNLSDDELLAKTFIDIMQIKADSGELSRIYREPQDRRGVLNVMKPGLMFGGMTAIGTFIALRRLPKHLIKRSLEKRQSFVHGRDGHPLFDAVRKQGPWLPHVKTRRDGSISYHEGWFLAPCLITIDAILACAMGFLVSLVSTSNAKLFEAIADIPLVPGRSAVSDALCTDFIANYKRLPKELWTPNKIQFDNVTKNLKRFVENCQRRQGIERQLRYDANLDESEPMEIPHPGVPADLAVEVEEPPDDVEFLVDKPRRLWLDDWVEEDDEDDLW